MNTHELTAGDCMRKDVKTIDQNESLLAAAKKMRALGVSSLVVGPLGANDAWGIVTRKDIVDALTERAELYSATQVEEIMSKPALTVSPSLSIAHCLQIMKMVGVRRLPVVEGDALKGIVSNTDIFQKITDQLD